MSVRYNKAKKKWVAVVSFKDTHGRFKKAQKEANTKKEAIALEELLRAEIKDNLSANDISVGTVAELMFKELEKVDKATSLICTKTRYKKYIKPFFEDTKISQISQQRLKIWLNDEIPCSLSLSTRQGCFWVMHQLLSYSDKNYGTNITRELDNLGNFRANPNELTKEGGILKFWTYDQFSIISNYILNKAKDYEPSNPLYIRTWSTYVQLNILYYCGLRRNEANALHLSDFHDSKSPYLEVTKTVTRKVKGLGWHEQPPKTRNSIRKVPVPKKCADIIRDHIETRLRFLPNYGDEKYLVGGNHPLREDYLDKIKEEAERACGVSHIVVHGLRHSYATTLINAGVQLELIATLMGDTPDIVRKTYAHYLPDTKDSTTEIFDRLDNNVSVGSYTYLQH